MSRPLAALVAASLLVGACSSGASTWAPTAIPSPTAAFPLTLVDDDGLSVTLAAPPARIVTFAPSITEILFALGLGDRIVGVSGPYDDHPAAAADIPEVGGAGDFGVDPNLETVVGLEPDLFLTIAGADAEAIAGAVADLPRVRCFFEVFYPPLVAAGPGTFIDDLLRRAGCDSVSASAASAYPEWSVEDLVAADVAVYLVSSESGADAVAVLARPGFDAVAAVAAGHVAVVDSDLVTRAGPRIVGGLRAVALALHPGIAV